MERVPILEDLIASVSYKPGWKITLQGLTLEVVAHVLDSAGCGTVDIVHPAARPGDKLDAAGVGTLGSRLPH